MIRSKNWDAATKGQIPVQLGLNLGDKGKVSGRNQPIRNDWEIPRAFLRWVFTGMVLNTVRTWRVSRSSTAMPASLSPVYSHCNKCPASKPSRAGATSRPPNQATSASGPGDNAHARAFQRHVDHCILFHGWSSRCLEQDHTDSAIPSV